MTALLPALRGGIRESELGGACLYGKPHGHCDRECDDRGAAQRGPLMPIFRTSGMLFAKVGAKVATELAVGL